MTKSDKVNLIIGLMAKLELFLGNPLFAISVVLASFLLFNGAGSAWVGRREARGRRPSVLLPAAGAAVVVPITFVREARSQSVESFGTGAADAVSRWPAPPM